MNEFFANTSALRPPIEITSDPAVFSVKKFFAVLPDSVFDTTLICERIVSTTGVPENHTRYPFVVTPDTDIMLLSRMNIESRVNVGRQDEMQTPEATCPVDRLREVIVLDDITKALPLDAVIVTVWNSMPYTDDVDWPSDEIVFEDTANSDSPVIETVDVSIWIPTG